MGINNSPFMENFKHLELQVEARCDETLPRWASLIEASSILKRLTLEVNAPFLTIFFKFPTSKYRL